MNIRRLTIVALLLTVISAAAVAVPFPSRPNPPKLVNDLASIFTEEQVNGLEQKLETFSDTTSNQIAVVTVADLDGYTPAEYATRIGNEWGIGSKDFNNGVVLLVKPKTPDSRGEVSIQVGYGLEGAIPDAYCKRIIQNDIIPHFRENDYYGGVAQAVDVLMALASGEITFVKGADEEEDFGYGSLLIIAVVLFFIWIFAKNNVKKGRNNRNNHRGGGSSSGGGYYPYSGSSRSSSSSSSGSSFGFGGGSFGGGGASGSW